MTANWETYAALAVPTLVSIVMAYFKNDPEDKRSFLKRHWPVIAAVGLVLLSFGFYISTPLTFEKTGEAFNNYRFENVDGKHFANAEVLLDGKAFSDCTFTNVTFKYNGTAPVRMANSHFRDTRLLDTENPIVGSTFMMLVGLNMMSPDVPIKGFPKALVEPATPYRLPKP